MSEEIGWMSQKDKWLYSHEWEIEEMPNSEIAVIDDAGMELMRIGSNVTNADLFNLAVKIRNDIIYNMKYYSS